MTDAGLGIVLTIVVGLLWGAVGVFKSHVGREGWSIPLFSAVSAVFSLAALCLFDVRWSVLVSGEASRSLDLALVMVPTSLVNFLGMCCLILAMRSGHNGYSWSIGQSAMIIPFLASIIIWGDAVCAGHWLGLLLMLSALVLIGLGKGRGDDSAPGQVPAGYAWLVLAIMGLVLLGIAQTTRTIPSRWEGWNDAASLRPVLGGVTVLLVTAAWALCKREGLTRSLVLTALACSMVGALSTVLLFRAMDLLGAAGMLAVLYPLAVGVCVISFSIYSALALHERYGLRGFSATTFVVGGITLLAV